MTAHVGNPLPPALSIIVAGPSAGCPHDRCLDALAPQVGDGIEVFLVVDRPSTERRPAWVQELVQPGASVLGLWATGVGRASGRIVALTSSTIVPGPDWVERTLELHGDGAAVVGGPIEPGRALRLVDWALYFCRYAAYLRPLAASGIEVPADNASYLREVLMRYRALWEPSFLEPFVHAAMRGDGHEVCMSDERVVRTLPGTKGLEFCRQRFRHGRGHGERRSAGHGRGHVLVSALSAPLVPALMTARAVAVVRAKRRHMGRCLVSLPLLLAFYSCWAAGELVGRLEALRRPRAPS